VKRLEGRRPRQAELAEQRREHLVGQRADARQRAEVCRQQQPLAPRHHDAVADAVVDVDVGAAEAEDRLLGIADDEQRAGSKRERERIDGRAAVAVAGRRGLGGGEHQEDLRLDRIGVLELVDEEPPVLRLQRPPDGPALAQHPCRHAKQVHVVHDVPPAPDFGVRGARVRQHDHRQVVDVRAPGLEERLDHRRGEVVDQRLDLLAAACPVLLDHVALPRLAELRERCNPVAPGEADAAVVLVEAPLQRARGLLRELWRRERLEAGPEAIHLFPDRGGLGRLPAAHVELDVLVLAHAGDPAVQFPGPDASLEQVEQRPPSRGPPLHEEVAPRLLAEQDVVGVAQLFEAGSHLRVHRPLAQQVRAERVDGAGEQALDAVQRAPKPPPLVVPRRAPQPILQRLLEPPAQLGGSLPRERDGRHPVHLEGAALDAGRHAHRQRVRLARPGAGLDEEVAAEVRHDPVAGRLVGGRRRFTHGT